MRLINTIQNIICGNESINDTLKFNLIVYSVSFIHICLGIMFFFMKINPLTIYNFLILVVYLFIYYLIKNKQFVLSFILAYFDIFFHAFLATLLIGWDFGFTLYIVALAPVSLLVAYSTENFPRRTFYPVIFSIISMILFILCSYFSDSLPVIYPYSNKKVIAGMYAFNAFIAFSMTILFSLLFTFEIRNAQLVMERRNRRLDVIASLDPLTGLLNRRSMEQHLNASIKKAKEQNRAFSLVLCDIDDFKKVNDTFGHDCGDQVLIKVSDIIRSHMREFDFVCRWGGEEILILLDCDINVAKLVVERIRYEINIAPLYFDETNVPFTMTFGISTYTEQCTVDSLIQQADEKLYIGKRNGKNKVVA